MALMAKFPAFFTGFPFGTILEILQNQPGNSGRVALVIQGDFHQIGGVYKFALPGEAFHKTIDAHFHRGTPDVGDFPMQDDCTCLLYTSLRYLNPDYAEQLNGMREKGIVAVEELLPSEAVTFNRRKVLAFLSKSGSRYSHAAILLRNAGIPYVCLLYTSRCV